MRRVVALDHPEGGEFPGLTPHSLSKANSAWKDRQMNQVAVSDLATRRSRLMAIAAAYTSEVYDPRAGAQLAGKELVFRFAAVTTAGPSDSGADSDGNLIVAESEGELAELLREECGEGWLAHGRVWDLDAAWHSWGNLRAIYSVQVGEAPPASIHVVQIEDREDGIFLFADRRDAELFAGSARDHGNETRRHESSLFDRAGTRRLIEVEQQR